MEDIIYSSKATTTTPDYICGYEEFSYAEAMQIIDGLKTKEQILSNPNRNIQVQTAPIVEENISEQKIASLESQITLLTQQLAALQNQVSAQGLAIQSQQTGGKINVS